MKPYVIRKCHRCNLWHVFSTNQIGDMIRPIVICSFVEWWEDGIMIINFPELYVSISE